MTVKIGQKWVMDDNISLAYLIITECDNKFIGFDFYDAPNDFRGNYSKRGNIFSINWLKTHYKLSNSHIIRERLGVK